MTKNEMSRFKASTKPADASALSTGSSFLVSTISRLLLSPVSLLLSSFSRLLSPSSFLLPPLTCLLLTPTPAQVIKAEAPAWVAPVPPELMTEPELIQQTIAMHLMTTDAEQARRQRQNMDIVVGDVRRVAGLPPERLRLLEIAAKGAVDRHMEAWRSGQENQVRQQALGTTAKQVRQRLEGMGIATVGTSGPPEENSLWRDTLTNVLTPEERAKWAVAETGRESYRLEAITKLLVAEMDRQLDLTLTQCEKIEPLAAKAVQDYLPDMGMYLDRGNGIDFRLLLTAFSGVPDGERQGVLTPQQINKWLQVTADFRSLWQNIEQNHMQRLQSASNPAAKPDPNAPVIIRGRARVPIIINGGAIRVVPAPNNGGIILQK